MAARSKIFLWLLGIIVAIGLIVFLLGPVLFASVLYPLPEQYRPAIAKWVPEYCQAVPDAHHLLSALIYTESTWHANARSGAGAVGLTQFIPSTANSVAKRLGVSPFTPSDLINNPEMAIRFGASYLCGRIGDYHGDVGKALIAYNGGGGAVIAFERGYPIRGTVAYRDKILSISRVYKSSYGEWWKNTNYTSAGTGTGDAGTSKSFDVTPKVTNFLNTPIMDFWKGLLSNTPATESTGTASTSSDNNGQLNNFWQNLLPGS
jgi:hypothetical protein